MAITNFLSLFTKLSNLPRFLSGAPENNEKSKFTKISVVTIWNALRFIDVANIKKKIFSSRYMP